MRKMRVPLLEYKHMDTYILANKWHFAIFKNQNENVFEKILIV